MDKIEFLMNTFRGETYNFCFEVLKLADDEAKAFEFVCKNYDERDKKEDTSIEAYFSEEEIEEYESVHGDIVNGLLNSTIKKCNLGMIPEADFYVSLWRSFCAVFTLPKEKAFAFYYTLIDAMIPYQYLGKPISMNNERFKELVKKNDPIIQKIKYIQRSNYSQLTERASLLLNCLEEVEDWESKTVVLAQAIKYFSLNRALPGPIDINGLLRQIDKKIAELEKQEEST